MNIRGSDEPLIKLAASTIIAFINLPFERTFTTIALKELILDVSVVLVKVVVVVVAKSVTLFILLFTMALKEYTIVLL